MHIHNSYSLLLFYIGCLLYFSIQPFYYVAASSQTSLALVIGNNYESEYGRLGHTVSDAEEIAKVLRESGFDVLDGYNLNSIEMLDLINIFYEKLSTVQDVVFVYFGGHGVHAKKYKHDKVMQYFLLPTELGFINKENIPFNKGIDIDRMLKGLLDYEENGYVSIIVLDTCHSNPYYNSHRYRNCTIQNLRLPSNSVVAYATNNKIVKNRLLYRKDRRKSLYIGHLIEEIKTAIRECKRITDMFTEINRVVGKEKWLPTHHKYKQGSKTPYFHGCPKPLPLRDFNPPPKRWTLQVTSNVRGARIFIDFEKKRVYTTVF